MKVLSVVTRCIEENEKYEIYTLIELLKIIPKVYTVQKVKILSSIIQFDSVGDNNGYCLEYLLELTKEEYSKEVMRYVGDNLIENEKN